MDDPESSRSTRPATAPHPQPAFTERSLIDEIGVRFPGWKAWRSDTLRWWAFRTAAAPLTIEQLRAGCRLIVQADTHAELCARVRAENHRAARADRAIA